MNKQLVGSCSDAATELCLSPLATLALRVALMILTRITFGTSARSLKVCIDSNSVIIGVSRLRRSSSNRSKGTGCTAVAASGSTATTPLETKPLHADASSYLDQLGNGSQP